MRPLPRSPSYALGVSTGRKLAVSVPLLDVLVDPVDNGTSNDIGLEDFVNGVYATLFSSPQGYEDIGQLLRDLE